MDLVSGVLRIEILGFSCENHLLSHGGVLGQGGGGGGGGRVTDSVVVGSVPVETGGQPLISWFCSTSEI